MSVLYPMKLTAPLKDYIWGGSKLKEEYGKKTDLPKVAESWELSCHKDGQSVVANGAYAGRTLTEVIEQEGKAVLGKDCESFAYFPILIKLIDAKDNLSVQVHPNNDYALRVEGEYGKTEMWYIVDCEPGARLLYGFEKEISKEEFAARIADNTLLDVTKAVEVKKGDVFFIEAGTLHAIGSGILICEIQQNSNTTYRIYDYGRIGNDGKPRQLHVEKAKDVTKLCPATRDWKPEGAPQQLEGREETLLASCDYFTVHEVKLDGKAELSAGNASFICYTCISGDAVIKTACDEVSIHKGETVFLPAGMGTYTLSGNAELIDSRV